ncbi:hypothetical protein C5O19_08475 [Siphonobacter curvatus]|uniref:Carboxyltransferase domain-containing protein n=2 Tax=Siphonobacter curvatus TaxID=2094562 RepID=A0A2S7IPK2_9BACT|nr:hypothetical protein C5O19_08475 [Siphonobacter curvatus]
MYGRIPRPVCRRGIPLLSSRFRKPMIARVVKAGVLTTVQDLGRAGYRSQGVVVGGAMDGFAHRISNSLVGNSAEWATLEVTFGGLELYFEAESWIAITGHGVAVRIDGTEADCWRPLRIAAGSRLQLAYTGQGCRSYVAIRGGWQVPEVLGSYSTYLPAGWGGYEGRALRTGDVLTYGQNLPPLHPSLNWSLAPAALPAYQTHPTVRVIRGPEWGFFTPESQRAFSRQSHEVLPQSNRMGYRLEARMQKLRTTELLSTAVTAGTIQVLPDGNLVVLMNDAPTTGGYPRIAQVIEPDLSVMAQLVRGNQVQFSLLSPEQAEDKYVQYQEFTRNLEETLVQRLHPTTNVH